MISILPHYLPFDFTEPIVRFEAQGSTIFVQDTVGTVEVCVIFINALFRTEAIVTLRTVSRSAIGNS